MRHSICDRVALIACERQGRCPPGFLSARILTASSQAVWRSMLRLAAGFPDQFRRRAARESAKGGIDAFHA